jgi:hypothetical protein
VYGRYLCTLIVNAYVVIAIIDLHVPMIREAAMSPVSHPDPAVKIDISALPLLRSLQYGAFFDLQFSPAICCESWLKWMRPAGREARLRHLINDFLRNSRAHAPVLEQSSTEFDHRD